MSKRRDWTQNVPPIVGNAAIIERSEQPYENIFERNRPNGDQMVTKTQPNGDQMAKSKRRKRRKRTTFTPNLVTEQILQQIRGRYGNFSAFINTSIEEYYNKVK